MSYWRTFPRFLTERQLRVDGMNPPGAVFHERVSHAHHGPTTLYWRDGAAWDVYEHRPWDEHGFGGATITLTLDTGERRALKGPWHYGHGMFSEFVKVPELRHRYRTRVVAYTVASRDSRTYSAKAYKARGILADIQIEGTYDASEVLAEQLARRHPGKRIHILTYKPGGCVIFSRRVGEVDPT